MTFKDYLKEQGTDVPDEKPKETETFNIEEACKYMKEENWSDSEDSLEEACKYMKEMYKDKKGKKYLKEMDTYTSSLELEEEDDDDNKGEK